MLVVDIHLSRDHDNPQLIFESLNSTGLALSQADLIRNYVLMGLKPDHQTRLYQTHWYPMEESFGHAEYTMQFNRFMRDYLTVKSPSGTIPNIGEVHAAFKAYVNNSNGQATIDNIVEDVHTFSRYFVNFAFAREEDAEINRLISSINKLRVDVAYPFFLELYDDYKHQLLTRADFISILKLVESYVFRRAICGIPTNSLNKTFATISRQVDKSHYLPSVQSYFLIQDSYRRFPTDDEFYLDFQRKDVYNFRSRNYLLDKLENYNHKEVLNVEGYTIEHIMPQNANLSPEWQHDLGPDWQTIQAQYLHTIGNLTLTGYNPELSDRPFQEKRDMDGGFHESHIRLNAKLAQLDVWNKSEIEKRAKELADKALKIWHFPQVPDSVVDSYKQRNVARGVPIVPLDEYLAYFDTSRQEQFQALRKRILNLDPSVEETVYKEFPNREWPEYHISYSSDAPLVDVVLQKTWMRLCLNADPDQLDDPKGFVIDVTGKAYWGGGNSLIYLGYNKDPDYALRLIRQALTLQLGENGMGSEDDNGSNDFDTNEEQWNGRDFYVAIGEGVHRTWDDCVKYGFISAGHGRQYSKLLEQLVPGNRVFAYSPTHGYVGVGVVQETAVPVKDFMVQVDGVSKPILALPLQAPQMGDEANDPELSEYLVRVEWLKTVTLDTAVWHSGLFSNQTVVCKLQSKLTLDTLEEQFGLDS